MGMDDENEKQPKKIYFPFVWNTGRFASDCGKAAGQGSRSCARRSAHQEDTGLQLLKEGVFSRGWNFPSLGDCCVSKWCRTEWIPPERRFRSCTERDGSWLSAGKNPSTCQSQRQQRSPLEKGERSLGRVRSQNKGWESREGQRRRERDAWEKQDKSRDRQRQQKNLNVQGVQCMYRS